MIPYKIFICDRTLEGIAVHSKNWEDLNPEYEIHLYDDKRCMEFLEAVNPLYKDIFTYIIHGPIKSDFWRLCILYEYGGVYVDADNVPNVPISEFYEPTADLVTCNSFWHATCKLVFNPAFIMCDKKNKFIGQCINTYVNWYETKEPYSYWGWSVMRVFNQLNLIDYDNKDGLYRDKTYGYNVQIIHEVQTPDSYDEYNIYNNVNVFNNRDPQWDEINHCFRA